MNNTHLKKQILKVLKTDERVWTTGTDDKKELNQTKLLSLVEEIDKNIIHLLLEDDNIRDKFFVNIKDVYVFRTNDFVFFMEENRVNNMFTKYKNRIGLTIGKRFLDDSKDVILNWPFKDCILEGGQSTEEGMDNYFQWQETIMKDKLGDEGNKIKEGRKNLKEVDVEGHYTQKQTKRKEIFFNEVIAADEIDRLEEPKVLVNWKRYTTKSKEKVTELKRDEEGNINENLIIKGNNLLALHSLKKEFTSKVKLIYIDPPYNTDTDSFAYNDSFGHSAWLLFMKNRIEQAYNFLKSDGVIFIHCDDNEQAYLKVLMDEVFGRHNFVSTLIHQRAKGGGNAKHVVKGHDYALVYAKNLSSELRFIRKKIIQSKVISIKGIDYLRNDDVVRKKFGKYDQSTNRRCFYEELSTYKSSTQISEINKKIKSGEFVLEDFGNGMQVICKYSPVSSAYSKVYSIIKALSEDGNNEISALGLNFDNPKPEAIIEFIINSVTDKGDLVLDYHLGSGTTAAVAHKMNRQYIGIEQMDYIETIAVERLKKVIGGEQGGISKSVNWQGGGEFIYCELAKWNETAKEKINECASLDKLVELFDTLYDKYFLNYNLKIKEFKEEIILEDNFRNLSLEEQKSMFLNMLDLNQMYVNESEMEDTKYDLSEGDIALTKKFYNKED
jgi:adenine-specific DNA-methyltransferase